jgi:hypothetical protein
MKQRIEVKWQLFLEAAVRGFSVQYTAAHDAPISERYHSPRKTAALANSPAAGTCQHLTTSHLRQGPIRRRARYTHYVSVDIISALPSLAITHHATVAFPTLIRTKPLLHYLSLKFLETAPTDDNTTIAPLSTSAPSAIVITLLVFEENARAALAFRGPWLVLIKSHGGAPGARPALDLI